MRGTESMRGSRLAWRTLVVALAVVTASLQVAAPASAATANPIVLQTLSNRADLVSGGDVLVEAVLPPGSAPSAVHLYLNGRDVTSAFAVRQDGRFTGLVDGLALGANTLAARGPSGSATLTITNHPMGGPVLSGPQLQPWTCQATAGDKQCNQLPSYSFVYRSTDPTKRGFQPYDPNNPPSDVAPTTTDQGVTVPFVVRIETGYMDRDQYQIATLFQPNQPWTTFNPQGQFNHKLFILHGASCDVDYRTGSAPDATGSSSPTGETGAYALGRGFMTMSTALDNSGHDCNVAVQAESLVMAKEYIAERYGTLRYTIGTGCSGGSLAEQWISNAYPGVYQGILPTCSFPDAWSAATQVADYALLEQYFTNPTAWGPGVVWSPTQWAAVEGNALPVDAVASVGCVQVLGSSRHCFTGYFSAAVPTHACGGISDQQRYDPQSNPGGVRCSIADLNANLLGAREPEVWTSAEKAVGHGFTGLPIDNVGVQYGLQALRDGTITPSQFVDLNAHIGGSDIDINPTPGRLVADQPALANAYRTGLINETNNLDQTAIIDCRGPDPGAAHDSFRAFAVRARLDREHGTHANQLIWEGPEPILGDSQCERNSFIAMDRWLTRVERDTGTTPLAQKLTLDKPDDLYDRCYDGNGGKLADGLCPQPVVPVYGTPRMVAGDDITTDVNKCRLKPLNRQDYPVPFADEQWAQLQQTFPDGVCDFTKPGVDQKSTNPWQTYQDASGKVVTGGMPLGPPPVSTATAN